MNRTALQIFNTLTGTHYGLSKSFTSFHPFKVTGVYFNYFFYLLKNWFPRVTTLETTTAAYTPAKVRYNVYIVYALFFGWVGLEFENAKCIREQAQKHYLSLRN